MALVDRLADYKRFEGYRSVAYQDTGGVWTIGYGHTPAKPGQTCSEEDAAAWLLNDDSSARCALNDDPAWFPWWRGLDDGRRDAVIELAFNMGEHTLDEFVNMRAALQAGEYGVASAQARSSDWYREVNGDGRGDFICALLANGVRPSP